MKVSRLFLTMLCGFAFSASAQTILNEDFESGSDGGQESFIDVNMPTGWSVVSHYVGNVDKYRWHNYYSKGGMLGGKHSACIDAASSFTQADDLSAYGPKEEILLTPELNLDDTYELSFLWKGASASALEKKEYDMQVRVVEVGVDPKNAPVVWSFSNPEQLKESGVPKFPWTGWTTYKSLVDLSQYKGKKVKVAFVHKMFKKGANIGYIDDVVVKKFTPITTSKPSLSKTMYSFGRVYVGSKMYSEAISLKNVGAKGLKVLRVEAPNGIGTTIKPEDVNLDKNETYDFSISYSAGLTTPAKGDVIIKTNGGDVKVQFVADKVALSNGCMFEGFEQGMPPAGWSYNNGWRTTGSAFEGELTAYCSGEVNQACELISPRLDLSTGTHKTAFTYFNQYYSEDGTTVATTDIKVMLSTDGGKTWTVKDIIDSEDGFNELREVEVDLGTPASDNCYLKWVYSPLSYGNDGLMSEISVFFLDRVILPCVYGIGGVPMPTEAITPENNAENLYEKEIELKWKHAQFAQGYKVYVGSDAAATNVVNGVDVKEATSYIVKGCAVGTTYNWKVVPYNEVGETQNVATWKFTTVADQTVKSYPYIEGFEGEVFPSLGWRVSSGGYTKWRLNETSPFDGKSSVSAHAGGNNQETVLETPLFVLPADKKMKMSFYWGNDMCVGLQKDDSGLVENKTVAADNIDACYFEIYVDGAWKQLAIISDKTNTFWCRERVDLAPYKGKTVSFRWRYCVLDYMKAIGVSLDNIIVEAASEEMAGFNVMEWNAGSVNFNQSTNSGNIITLSNEGNKTLKVESVQFSTPNFESSLAVGTVLEVKKGVAFTIIFNALTAAKEVSDNMVVTFEGGYKVSLPVKGNGLSEDIRYYNFENDVAGEFNPEGFTTIDVDRKPTAFLTGLEFPGYGQPFAFSVQEDKTWNNVIEPVSGGKVLVALTPFEEGLMTDDWLISNAMVATAQSNFKFHARNWESINSVLPGTPSSIEVLVSTTVNNDTKAFETVMDKVELPLYDKLGYKVYNVDLSKYAGQKVYIALRHTVLNGLGAFFDDFYFEHFTGFDAGVETVMNEGKLSVYPNPATSVVRVKGVEVANISVMNMAGAIVLRAEATNEVNAEELPAGVYVMMVQTNENTFSTRFIKK